MKKLMLYLLLLILLPLQSQAIIQEISEFAHTKQEMIKEWWKKFNEPSEKTQNQSEQLHKQFNRIIKKNWHNTGLESEYVPLEVSSDDTETILTILANIKTEDINKRISPLDGTFLKTCISETSRFAPADAEKITQKLLEKGADIAYNPQKCSHCYHTYCEIPLWQAALQGNVGAYKAMINHAQENHLSQPYEDKILKLPHVIGYALERLKIMENHYKSELKKIKDGKREKYTYKYFNQFGSGSYGPYTEYKVIDILLRIAWFKNRFQKIQEINTQYCSENKHPLSPANTPEEESIIVKFLENRIETFDEYTHGTIYESYEAGLTNSYR